MNRYQIIISPPSSDDISKLVNRLKRKYSGRNISQGGVDSTMEAIKGDIAKLQFVKLLPLATQND